MKNRILALALVLALLPLSGCAPMLSREFLSVSPHNITPAAEEDSSAIRVENYQELVSAVLYLVSQGTKEGVVRLHNYKRDVEADLAAACAEVSHDDPLGAYAVDYIRHSYVHIVTYYDATLTIGYRRTAEQIAGVIPVTGSGAIRAALRETLASFATEAVLRVNYFDGDEAYLQGLVHQAYYDTPGAAFGLPQARVTLYPDSGVQRIVEIALTYPASPQVLLEQSAALTAAAKELLLPIQGQKLQGEALVTSIFQQLRTQLALSAMADGATTTSSPYALVAGAGDSEATALAFKLLCDLAGVTCTVVEGQRNSSPYFWNIVTLAGSARHVDASRPGGLLLTDAALEALVKNITWNRDEHPVCSEPILAPHNKLQQNT